ncbi:MAG TPA: altronate dehydrogenase [Gemmataceae bacterium]|jgi:tagaturonate reductase|nr:altronate dehydrogenase [Gemmataceae bacterium]
MSQLPETVLQFGSGKFLRAFADLFIHQANLEGQEVGRVVAVQTTGEERARLLNQQGGRYHVLVRGLDAGSTVDRTEEAASISRALVASRQWPEVLAVARSPDLRYVISNTAEVGYTLDAQDRPTDAPPRSFPAKLLLLLKERYEAGRPGVTLLPCELFDGNADRLLGIVLELAKSWNQPAGLADWMRTECRWRNTLVDRIVAVAPPGHPLLETDALLTVTEPFALWAVEVKEGRAGLFRHQAIVETTDVQPFFLRKVRILNAAHTALLSKALPRGMRTVREAVLDPEIADWLTRLLLDEIIPTLRGRVEAPEEFARQTLERFRNPFLEHKLSDIAAYHDAKVAIRLVPTRAEFVEKFGRLPPLLYEAIAGAHSATGG